MSRLRVVLRGGDPILLPNGMGTVTRINRDGYAIADPAGEITDVPWTDLVQFESMSSGGERAIHRLLSPWWEMLDEQTRQRARGRLEVVLEIKTGFRDGLSELARDGEPFEPYGPTWGASLHAQCERMASELTREREGDRSHQRRILQGELKSRSVSGSTIKLWMKRFETDGLLGLVDGRKLRRSGGFEVLDPQFREFLLEEVESFDGDVSMVNHREVIRRAKVAMKKAGRADYAQPQRATGEFVSWLFKERGKTTRAQRSNAIRGSSGNTQFPAIRPGQVVAIDATRADVLVWDELHERAMSVEIVTALDVATRVILACRVVPKSADGIDAGLILYDIMRPFSMKVSGTKVSDWRWAGVPEAIDLTNINVVTERGPLSPVGTLQGEHHIPAVLPEAIRCDHGSIFVSSHFRNLCREFGIDLLLSRGRRPSDNAHGERIHLTYDRFYQQLPGYKSNNVAGRGRKVEEEPLYTARELEAELRRWIGTDYHQTWHQGLILPGKPKARLTPIGMFDAKLDATGRIDLPLSPTALYQFLPVRWATISHDGVEIENMPYDAKCLDDFRNVRKGQFHPDNRSMPFFYDPHDVSRVWWNDPDTDIVHEIPFKGRDQFLAPLTRVVADSALRRIKDRGGNLALNRESTANMILDELTEITTKPPTRESRAKLSAAARRVEISERDHAEAQAAQEAAAATGKVRRLSEPDATSDEVSMFVDEWPDLLGGA